MDHASSKLMPFVQEKLLESKHKKLQNLKDNWEHLHLSACPVTKEIIQGRILQKKYLNNSHRTIGKPIDWTPLKNRQMKETSFHAHDPLSGISR